MAMTRREEGPDNPPLAFIKLCVRCEIAVVLRPHAHLCDDCRDEIAARNR